MPRILTPAEIQTFRSELCRVATRLFAERGYAGVTLRAIADQAGCSRMTPYRYFRDKEEIFAAVRADAFARFADAQESVARETRDPGQRLHALGEAYLRFALEEPHAYRIMFELEARTSGFPELEKQGRRAFQALLDATEDALRAGLLTGDARTRAHLFWAGLHGIVTLHLADQLHCGRSFEELVSPMMEALFRGARPQEGEPR